MLICWLDIFVVLGSGMYGAEVTGGYGDRRAGHFGADQRGDAVITGMSCESAD